MRKSFANRHLLSRRSTVGVNAPTRCQWIAMVLLGGCVAVSIAGAQVVPGAGAAIGTMAADRARVRQITGAAPDSAAFHDSLPHWRAVRPTLRFAWNSDLPNAGNDAALWAGRGTNFSLTGGVEWLRALRSPPFQWLEIVLSPELDYSQNLPFPDDPGRAPGRQPGRSAFSSPWHTGQSSADLPLRFGDRSIRSIGLGQSSITIVTDRVAFGASNASEWWGPALRNTLLFSDNAAGVPRLFARTAQPIRTRFGDLEGRAIIGALTESPFFDEDPGNNTRSLSGLLVTYRPAIDTGLTLGLSRLVMARATSNLGVVQHALDVVLHYEPIQPERDTSDAGQSYQHTDQLFSLFARWIFPASGFETYVEWSRMELPRSIREYLEVPQSTQGYTIGLQWAQPHARASYFRLQGEVTYLEQTQVLPDRPPPDYYTGRAAAQGFTQRGQVLGATIGPGSSTQFIGADWLAPRWQLGGFVGRTRTEEGAMERLQDPNVVQHDVTIFSGVRGGARVPHADISSELTVGRRLNYLFQNEGYLGLPSRALDIQNITLTFTLSPR
jgi:hypothetical protein